MAHQSIHQQLIQEVTPDVNDVAVSPAVEAKCMWPLTDNDPKFISREWRLMLLASAYHVIEKRDAAKPRKDQRVDDFVSSELLLKLETAKKTRIEFARITDRRYRQVRTYMPTQEAVICLAEAWHACQITREVEQTESVCCFSQQPVQYKVLLHSINNGVRKITTHSISDEWRSFVQAAMVVGNIETWLDECVSEHIPEAHEQWTLAKHENMASMKSIKSMRIVFRDTCMVLVRAIENRGIGTSGDH